ncbi:MAG TPA: Rpn family recombination-promoting nuclease/putative transposase [Thermoanaerobaculia bacterium]|nr:Rpn family recombination-promoting nuclease/putative transposase [Thermoanaerobaculia bacterium]
MEHDNGYKALFSHPEMVQDLLRGFVHEDWVDQLDFSTLERVEGSFVTPGLRRRESDVVWRLRWRDRWLYVYLLMEFQSTVDPYMALRLMVYVGLLYQHLIQNRQLPESGKLPPVLPLVLYNGYALWDAARELRELIEEAPGSLKRYQPQLRYCLLDEGRIAEGDLGIQNLAAALFRLERSQGLEEIQGVLGALLEWLVEPEQAPLRRSFTAWLKQVLLPARVPGVAIPEVSELEEVRSMLAERVKDWTREWKQEGFEKGFGEGLEKGFGEGLEKGLEKGIEKGLEKGHAALLRELEKRFGPLSEVARQRVESLDSFEKIVELSAAVSTAPSLGALGLS